MINTNLEKEKALSAKLVHEVLIALHKDFPWTVIEIAITFNERIGEDNPFVVQALNGILDEHAKEQLKNYNPECDESGILPAEVSKNLYSKFSQYGYTEAYNKTMFGLPDIKDECSPWDIAEETPVFENISNEKNMAIKNIKMKLRELAILRGILGRHEKIDENTAIDAIFEVLNFELI